MTACAIIPSDNAWMSGVLGYVDCQARTIGEQGYAALTLQGSQAALLLTAMLTILAALVGYRLLLGHIPDVREGVLTFARIGLVLALATSWNAYRTLAFDVALSAPTELAAEVGGAARLPGTAGIMSGHLDAVDQMYQSLGVAGVGGPVPFDIARQLPPPMFPGFDTFAIGASRTVFLTSGIAALGATRLLAGILLAVGPLFFGFLLFDATRGLFGAWLKGLMGAALGSLLVSISLGVEMALLEPWLSALIQRRNAGEAILAAPGQLLALSIVFAMFLLVSVIAGLKLAQGVTFAAPGRLQQVFQRWQSAETTTAHGSVSSSTSVSALAQISRASALAETIRRSEQRHHAAERMASAPPSAALQAGMNRASDGVSRSGGATTQRRRSARTTASAARRIRRS